MIVSKHVVNIYLMQSPNQNLPLSKEKENRSIKSIFKLSARIVSKNDNKA
jgi:hypothetical protein